MALYGGGRPSHTNDDRQDDAADRIPLAPILVAKDADVALQAPTTWAVSPTR
jgi:hypothetical protein